MAENAQLAQRLQSAEDANVRLRRQISEQKTAVVQPWCEEAMRLLSVAKETKRLQLQMEENNQRLQLQVEENNQRLQSATDENARLEERLQQQEDGFWQLFFLL